MEEEKTKFEAITNILCSILQTLKTPLSVSYLNSFLNTQSKNKSKFAISADFMKLFKDEFSFSVIGDDIKIKLKEEKVVNLDDDSKQIVEKLKKTLSTDSRTIDRIESTMKKEDIKKILFSKFVNKFSSNKRGMNLAFINRNSHALKMSGDDGETYIELVNDSNNVVFSEKQFWDIVDKKGFEKLVLKILVNLSKHFYDSLKQGTLQACFNYGSVVIDGVFMKTQGEEYFQRLGDTEFKLKDKYRKEMVAPLKTTLKPRKDISKNLEIKSAVKQPPTTEMTDVNSTLTLNNATETLNNQTNIEQTVDQNKNEETTFSSTRVNCGELPDARSREGSLSGNDWDDLSDAKSRKKSFTESNWNKKEPTLKGKTNACIEQVGGVSSEGTDVSSERTDISLECSDSISRQNATDEMMVNESMNSESALDMKEDDNEDDVISDASFNRSSDEEEDEEWLYQLESEETSHKEVSENRIEMNTNVEETHLSLSEMRDITLERIKVALNMKRPFISFGEDESDPLLLDLPSDTEGRNKRIKRMINFLLEEL